MELLKIFMQKSVYITLIILIWIPIELSNGPMNTIVLVDPELTGVMLLIGLSSIFTREYSSGVDNYILSSKKGRRELVWAKINASLIYTMTVILVWELFNITVNYLRHGNKGWGNPIQTFPQFSESPYDLSIVEYHFLQIGIHLLGACCFALLIVFISSISKNSLIAFIMSALILFGPVLEFVDDIKISWLLAALPFAFYNILEVKLLFMEVNTVEILSYPIEYPEFACLLMIALSVILIKLVLYVVKNKESTF